MKKKTTEEFKLEAVSVHDDRYDYTKTQYNGATTHVTIICNDHGEFTQTPSLHLRGSGCKKCFNETMYSNQETFISKASSIHNMKYDYSKVCYAHSKKHVIIICPEHGDFLQSPNSHLKGSGCPECKKLTLHCKNKNTLDIFMKNAHEIHNFKYSYHLSHYITNKIPVTIVCPVHGEFTQRPDSHINGQGCPSCKTSHSIRDIIKILDNNDIQYELEKRFTDCKNIVPLPFDLFLPNYNICLEYDGRQHFEIVEHWGGNDAFMQRIHNDSIKNQYCKDKDINLLRIKYDEDHIETLKRYFKKSFGINLKD